jgi:hypothetical protein
MLDLYEVTYRRKYLKNRAADVVRFKKNSHSNFPKNKLKTEKFIISLYLRIHE